MQATFDNWTGSSADAEPVWFDGSKFDDQSFDANAYVDDLKRYVRVSRTRCSIGSLLIWQKIIAACSDFI